MFSSPEQVGEALRRTGYIADRIATTTVFLAAKLHKPVLLEGPAGSGKTQLAYAVAEAASTKLERLQCYEDIDEEKAIGKFDEPLQRLCVELKAKSASVDWESLRTELHSLHFFSAGPLLRALQCEKPCVLLIDELDKVDHAFEALAADDLALENGNASNDKSLFPVTDSGRPVTKESHEGFLNERDLQRTATKSAARVPEAGAAGPFGSIPPFGEQQAWQAPPYQAGSDTGGAEAPDLGKAEREAMEKSSLIYVRSASASSSSAQARELFNNPVPELGLGLASGTRLRARLESAASTAVRTPVLAVIEYNYEREGEIVVPAGAKAVGHIRNGDRSGYVDIQFDSLLMPQSFPSRPPPRI